MGSVPIWAYTISVIAQINFDNISKNIESLTPDVDALNFFSDKKKLS